MNSKPSAKSGRFLVLAMMLLLSGCSGSEAPTVDALESQLAGNHCRFDNAYGNGCTIRNEGFWQWLFREPHHCDMAAVECLSEIRSPEAYETLMDVLRSKANIQTCDGTYYIRTRAVEALGESGYLPAVDVLKAYRDSAPVEKLSSGASGCEARPEPLDGVEEALARLAAAN